MLFNDLSTSGFHHNSFFQKEKMKPQTTQFADVRSVLIWLKVGLNCEESSTHDLSTLRPESPQFLS
jgi:hypothetical protein